MSPNEIANLPHHCYLITNTENGKQYVGVTYKVLEDRLKEHYKVSRSKNPDNRKTLQNAILKYGIDKFKIELIETFPNKKLAYEAEPKYIIKYDSKNNGYNESQGGDCGPVKFKYSDEVIINIIKLYCSRKSPKEISKIYSMPYHTVFDITRLRVSPLYNIPQDLLDELKIAKLNSKKRKRLNSDNIINIATEFVNDIPIPQIAKTYGISKLTVWDIVNRTSWKSIKFGDELERKLQEKWSSPRYWKSR